jgi:hypothetical protein
MTSWGTDVPNMSLSDEDTRMMDAFRQPTLKYLRLQPSFQEIFDFQSQYIIETHSRFVEHTDAHKPADEGVSFEQALWIFGIELEKFTGGTTDL